MRIDLLLLENYKKFTGQTLEPHPRFSLLIGPNGSGKTSLLDAIAVALGIWLVEPPDTTLQGSGRNIRPTEIRLEPSGVGDRVLFREQRPVVVSATGQIGERDNISWLRQVGETGRRTTNQMAREALTTVRDIYRRDQAGERVLCPVIAYYGAGRAWLPSNQKVPDSKRNGPARRWAAFYDCLNERIRLSDLKKWFKNELIAGAVQGGRMRPGFEHVRHAVLNCIPGADNLWFDGDLDQIVLSIDGWAQPYGNLSAGQQMLLALVADIAIKAVTQNNFLVTRSESDPEVLQRSPGVVLIDEIDVHLHPEWQRRVVRDLMRTFPKIQFIVTTHSPQVVGELPNECVFRLNSDGTASHPHIGTRGTESNEILRDVMDSTAQDPEADRLEVAIDRAIDDENLPLAEELYNKFLSVTEEPTIQRSRVRALIETERSLAEGDL